jgi:hypothetical protein
MSLKSGNYYKTVARIEEALDILAVSDLDVSGVVSAFKLEFQDLSAQVQEMDASMVVVETRLDGMDVSMSVVETRLDGMDVSMSVVETRLDGMDVSMSVVETRLDGMDASMVVVETRLDGMDASMVAVETSLEDLSGSVDAEFLKVGFIIVGEAEGLLTTNSFPFSFGNGSPQAAGFGVSVPFRANLKNLSLVTNTTDISFLVRIQMIHYSYSTNIETLLGEEISFQTSKQTQINITTPGNGHIAFKVTFIRGGGENDRFRLSLVFSADENLFLT